MDVDAKRVSNPLTVIAIFASLAEVALTVALGLVEPHLQEVFVWFVMSFPAILVILFFLTLNFNPHVLYAPSDFQNEENFLTTMAGNQMSREKEESKVEVSRENFEAMKAEIENLASKESRFSVNSKNPRAIKAASDFFTELLNNVGPLFKEKKLSSLNFGRHSDNFFLLSLDLPEEKLADRTASSFEFIIFVTESRRGSVLFEVVGENIKSDDYREFASMLLKRILKTSERRFENPQEKREEVSS